ncbi:MAG: hypothetical protein H6937_03230 [Burkholderiales bacterium]|nr:hypothetical protein [Burkholderiales bacterium]
MLPNLNLISLSGRTILVQNPVIQAVYCLPAGSPGSDATFANSTNDLALFSVVEDNAGTETDLKLNLLPKQNR